MAQAVKNTPEMQETQEAWIQSLSREDPLAEGMTTHSSILAWRIPWTEEPGELWFMESRRAGCDWSEWAQRKYFISPPQESCAGVVPRMGAGQAQLGFEASNGLPGSPLALLL